MQSVGEDGAFWEEFLRRLVARGLKGVRLVISDAHEGLKAAIKKILTGTKALSGNGIIDNTDNICPE